MAVPFVRIQSDGRTLTMFAQLRLIHRMLAVEGQLEEISALLACAVILPDIEVADFIVLNTNKRKDVMDSYFNCINFFLELVNGELEAVFYRNIPQVVT